MKKASLAEKFGARLLGPDRTRFRL